MIKQLFVIFLFSLGTTLFAQQPTIQEKLGFPKTTKLLIIHADDLGVAHSENSATIKAMESAVVNSASIMVPTPWFTEIASYAVANPKSDFGLHLTVTSEWKNYKWGPLSDKQKVPGLVNKNGFLFSSADSVYQKATPAEIEKELRYQIEKALSFGIDVTHFDSHMAVLYNNAEYLKVLIRLGREFKVPVMLSKTGVRSAIRMSIDSFLTEKDVLVDAIYSAGPADFKKGMDQFYTGLLKTMNPGVNIFIIHTAYDDKEMQAITIDHPDWGAAWRQADYDFFTSEKARQLLKENNIQLITWREIRDKLLR